MFSSPLGHKAASTSPTPVQLHVILTGSQGSGVVSQCNIWQVHRGQRLRISLRSSGYPCFAQKWKLQIKTWPLTYWSFLLHQPWEAPSGTTDKAQFSFTVVYQPEYTWHVQSNNLEKYILFFLFFYLSASTFSFQQGWTFYIKTFLSQCHEM